jgi:hypothetical protein
LKGLQSKNGDGCKCCVSSYLRLTIALTFYLNYRKYWLPFVPIYSELTEHSGKSKETLWIPITNDVTTNIKKRESYIPENPAIIPTKMKEIARFNHLPPLDSVTNLGKNIVPNLIRNFLYLYALKTGFLKIKFAINSPENPFQAENKDFHQKT